MIVLVFPFDNVIAQNEDTLSIYWMESIEVTAKKISWGDMGIPMERDNYTKIFKTGGFSMIRKGIFFAQDIYSDGFKRGDINVIVDGEHYHNACPNRMDSPLTRVNPMEIDKINLVKNSGSLHSGLAGTVSFRREKPTQLLKIRGGVSHLTIASNSTDAAFSASGYNYRVNGRYAFGSAYKDADGSSFTDLYNYKKDYKYRLGEFSVQGEGKRWGYRLAYSYTEDVMFPYLMMDERDITVYSGFLSYDNNKLYLNYTDHIMDNGLRRSMMPMTMITDAKNLTIGLSGDHYDMFYRNWDADNRFDMPSMTIENHLMPDIDQFSFRLSESIDFYKVKVVGKVGFIHNSVGDKDRMSFYRQIYPNADSKLIFATFGFSAGIMNVLTENFVGGIMIEAASDAPPVENLYIAVRKPNNKPYWLGNPKLNNPYKSSLKGIIDYRKIRLEVFGTKVWDYVNLARVVTDDRSYITYKNIDGIIFGFNLVGEWRFIDATASYSWAKNNTDNTPMSEIAPFSIITTIKSPKLNNIFAYLKHTYNDAQHRTSEIPDEWSSPSWHRVDMGLSYTYKSLRISAEMENINNSRYYQHLSYLRNPFSSGDQVYEPGRSLRINLFYN
jgi:iron complex outermembrane receptor protein